MELHCAIGGRESNSFVTVSEADVLVEELPDDTSDWDSLDTDQKKFRLILGAALMDYLPFRGNKVYCGQALCFPRTVQDQVHSIPEEAKMTQVFLAYSVVHRGLANRPASVTTDFSTTPGKSVTIGGMLSVVFGDKTVVSGTMLENIIKSPNFPACLLMKRWMTGIRGGVPCDSADVTCSTTTTTTTTTSTTTTTT